MDDGASAPSDTCLTTMRQENVQRRQRHSLQAAGLGMLPKELLELIIKPLDRKDRVAALSSSKALLNMARSMPWLWRELTVTLRESQLPSFMLWLQSQRGQLFSLKLSAGSRDPRVSEQLMQALCSNSPTDVGIRWDGPFTVLGPAAGQAVQLQRLTVEAHSFEIRPSLRQLTALTRLALSHDSDHYSEPTMCPSWLPASLASLVLEGSPTNPFQPGGQFPRPLADVQLDFYTGGQGPYRGPGSTPAGLEALARLPELPALTSLWLGGTSDIHDMPQQLSLLTGLRHLSLSSALQLAHDPLLPLLGMLQLTHLDLSLCWLETVPVGILRLPHLQSLHIDRNPYIGQVPFSEATAPLSHLALDLLPAVTSGLELAQLPKLERLEILQDPAMVGHIYSSDNYPFEIMIEFAQVPDAVTRRLFAAFRDGLPCLRELVLTEDVMKGCRAAWVALQRLQLARPGLKATLVKG